LDPIGHGGLRFSDFLQEVREIGLRKPGWSCEYKIADIDCERDVAGTLYALPEEADKTNEEVGSYALPHLL